MSYAELPEITRVNQAYAASPPQEIVLVNDVLNSGKHFKVADQLLAQRFPSCPIIGVLVARCVRDGAANANEHDDLATALAR